MFATRAGQLVWWTIPFGYRLRSYRAARAVVRVFFGLLDASALPGDGPAALTLNLQDVVLGVALGGVAVVGRAPGARISRPWRAAFGLSARREAALGPGRAAGDPRRASAPGCRCSRSSTRPARCWSGRRGWARSPATLRWTAIAGADRQGPGGVAGARGAPRGDGPRRPDDGRGLVWMASVPVGYRRASCPAEVHGRCYVVLFASVTTSGDAGARGVHARRAGRQRRARRGACERIRRARGRRAAAARRPGAGRRRGR